MNHTTPTQNLAWRSAFDDRLFGGWLKLGERLPVEDIGPCGWPVVRGYPRNPSCFRLVTSAPEPVGVETETEKHTRLLNEAGWRTQPEPKRLTFAEKMAAARTAKLKSPQPEPTKPVEPKCACGASLVTAAKPGAAKCGECAIAEEIGFDDPSPLTRPPAFPDRTPAEKRLRHPASYWSGRNSGRRRL